MGLTVLIRMRSLGDTVLMTPALEILKRSGRRTGVLVESPFHEILIKNPFVDELIVVDGKPSWRARLRALAHLRRLKPEEVIDLHGGTTASLISALSGARRRVGYAASRNSRFYNVEVPDTRGVWGKERLHTVEHQLAPLKVLNYPVEPVPPLCVPVDPDALSSVMHLLETEEIDLDFILLHPAAAFETKQWASENFAALAQRLCRDGYQVVATCGPGEEEVLQPIREVAGTTVSIIPPLPLAAFTALTSLCGLYVGNDTGTTHIAAAQKKPVVVIFGSSDSRVWYPWDVPYRLLRSGLECIPCPGYTCLYYDKPRCIRQITVDQVYSAVREMAELNLAKKVSKG